MQKGPKVLMPPTRKGEKLTVGDFVILAQEGEDRDDWKERRQDEIKEDLYVRAVFQVETPIARRGHRWWRDGAVICTRSSAYCVGWRLGQLEL